MGESLTKLLMIIYRNVIEKSSCLYYKFDWLENIKAYIAKNKISAGTLTISLNIDGLCSSHLLLLYGLYYDLLMTLFFLCL